MSFNMRTSLLGFAFIASLVEAQGPILNTTSTASPVVYTTEVVTALTTVCPGPTIFTVNNKAYTVTSSTTLTITDCPCTISKPAAPTGALQCAQSCTDAYNKCRSDPNANRSTCAAQYASCLGYNPYGSDGSLITPTACSGQPSATTTAAATASVSSCPQKCSDAYNTCRSQPDANRSTCASQYAACLGYNPFGSDGSLITPTACSGSAAATAATTSTRAVVTAGAGRFVPAGGLLALGAVALL